MKTRSGYTAIELAAVVAVVGILLAIAWPNLVAMKERARYKQTKVLFARVLVGAKLIHHEKKTLVQAFSIETPQAGSCSLCLQTATPGTDPLTWKQGAADPHWKLLGFEQTPIDGWGRELAMKANEGEFEFSPFSAPAHSDSRYDAVYSAGADHIWCGNGDGDEVCGDDLMLVIPHLDPLRTSHQGADPSITVHGDKIGQ